MISFIRGKLYDKKPTTLVLETNGIGYEVEVPLSTFEALNDVEGEVLLLTYLHVREDGMSLFGFATEDERQTFRDLLSVSGIGPKLALSILSGSNLSELQRNIAQGDETALTRIRGLGKKTAQRLIIDLKDKFAKKVSAIPSAREQEPRISQQTIEEAVLALYSLGYSRSEGLKAVEKVLSKVPADVTVEGLVRAALKG